MASCAQLRAAVQAGVSHVTVYRNLTAADDDQCQFPLRVMRPLTVRGACGDGRDKCLLHGGATLVRKDRNTCRQKCTECVGGRGGPIFDVRAGGQLTLANLELSGGCNTKDGAGGAVVVRGSEDSGNPNENTPSCRDTIQENPLLPSWADADEASKVIRDLRDEKATATAQSAQSQSRDTKKKQPSASLTAVGVTFSENLVTGGGGTVYNTNTNELQRTEPWNGRGGAVAILDADASATFVTCEFTRNEAWGSAAVGAISQNAYAADVGEGGAVYVNQGTVFVAKSQFLNNVAEKEGGAVFVDNGATVTLAAVTLQNNTVTDDYWDGGGGIFLGGVGTHGTIDVARFINNQVTEYPDTRRRALTCGGGAVSVTRGAEVSFRYTLFERNEAPRGGAVCVHDATAQFDGGTDTTENTAPGNTAVFRGNKGKHTWFDKPPGDDVECVQCISAVPNGQTTATTSPSRCAYLRNSEATRRIVNSGSQPQPACAPPPNAFSFDKGSEYLPTQGDGGTAMDENVSTQSTTSTGNGNDAPTAPPGLSSLESAFAAAFGDGGDDEILVRAAGEAVDAKRTSRSEGSF